MIVINDNIKRYYVLGGLKTQKEGLKKKIWVKEHKKGIQYMDCDNWQY